MPLLSLRRQHPDVDGKVRPSQWDCRTADQLEVTIWSVSSPAMIRNANSEIAESLQLRSVNKCTGCASRGLADVPEPPDIPRTRGLNPSAPLPTEKPFLVRVEVHSDKKREQDKLDVPRTLHNTRPKAREHSDRMTHESDINAFSRGGHLSHTFTRE